MIDGLVYTITEEGDSLIPRGIETMDEWLISLDSNELDKFHQLCGKKHYDITEDEDYEISRHALFLYCRELQIDEISITQELIEKIGGLFCVNVLLESLRRKGIVTASPLLLYKDSKVQLTEKGKEIAEKHKEQEEN